MVHGSATSLGCKLLNLLDLEHAPLLSAGLTAMLPTVPRLAGWQEVHKLMVLPESGSTHGQNQKRCGTSMDCRGTVHLGAGSCTGRVGATGVVKFVQLLSGQQLILQSSFFGPGHCDLPLLCLQLFLLSLHPRVVSEIWLRPNDFPGSVLHLHQIPFLRICSGFPVAGAPKFIFQF